MRNILFSLLAIVLHSRWDLASPRRCDHPGTTRTAPGIDVAFMTLEEVHGRTNVYSAQGEVT